MCSFLAAGPLAAPLPTPSSRPVTPAPTTAPAAVNPPANPGPVPTATQACGQNLVCQHGGVCNQTPGSQAGDGYFCACLNGFTGLDCSVGSTGERARSSSAGGSSFVRTKGGNNRLMGQEGEFILLTLMKSVMKRMFGWSSDMSETLLWSSVSTQTRSLKTAKRNVIRQRFPLTQRTPLCIGLGASKLAEFDPFLIVPDDPTMQ